MPRLKTFGAGPCVPLDRNARARLDTLADAFHRQGKISHTARLVFTALLRVFHNKLNGRCDPSWEAIAQAAGISRASVGRGLAALEAEGVELITWCHRFIVERYWNEAERRWRKKARRTSNQYEIHDPIAKPSYLESGVKGFDLDLRLLKEDRPLHPQTKADCKRLAGQAAGLLGLEPRPAT